jgi:hypothetical protein
MENDEFELSKRLFNRLKNYLITNNAVQKIELRNDDIWIYSSVLSEWYCWFYMSLNKKESLKAFLIGSKYKHSFFVDYKISIDPVVRNLCKCIGKPCCLEELAIKMDLMGI